MNEFVNSIYVDIFVKDKNILNTIQKNAETNNFTDITYIFNCKDKRNIFRI